MKKLINWIKGLFPIENPFEKVRVFVFIHEEYKSVMLFSYDMTGLTNCVERYSMRGHVEERLLSKYAHIHLKRTVSELRFNESGDIIVKNARKNENRI